ncbi:uncharacterized protein LOC117654268 isoform X2 [Thrips palmi]|uniref:Uncharacterized protein LOC117654268 isoform X2 n=1 Tax=Thrips palmi TaxID=161013 RepID=A0A6P9AE93_THRPL|nr:uncharacterized protein LOC117654268 isoform X2 [Thrips palmi]
MCLHSAAMDALARRVHAPYSLAACVNRGCSLDCQVRGCGGTTGDEDLDAVKILRRRAMDHSANVADLSNSESTSSTASGMDTLRLLSLPDDALLAVLAYLSPRELFCCRVACRCLSELCLHPDLWRSVELRYAPLKGRGATRGLMRAALSLAPCLRKVFVEGEAELVEAVASMLSATACVIAGLKLSITGSSGVALARTILQAVHSLGGLKVVDLETSAALDTTDPELLHLVYNLQGLRELKIFIGHNEMPQQALLSRQEPSLTSFWYCSTSTVYSEPWLSVFLETHAATLEEVDLTEYCGDDEVYLTLRTLPKLRSVNCPPVPAALDFIRQSSQLRSVAFTPDLIDAINFPATGALQALTESRSVDVLEALYLYTLMSDPDLMALAACLPRLPALRHLSFQETPSDDFLRAVTPKSAPRLTTLTIWCEEDCLLAWVRSTRIQDLLQRNPQLHLKVWEDPYGDEDSDRISCDCWFCDKERIPVSAFSLHRRTADCPRGCLQVAELPCSSVVSAVSSNGE